jgi:hypothetical protein
MAASEERITEQAQAGWKGFARFLFVSTATVALALIILALTLL